MVVSRLTSVLISTYLLVLPVWLEKGLLSMSTRSIHKQIFKLVIIISRKIVWTVEVSFTILMALTRALKSSVLSQNTVVTKSWSSLSQQKLELTSIMLKNPAHDPEMYMKISWGCACNSLLPHIATNRNRNPTKEREQNRFWSQIVSAVKWIGCKILASSVNASHY